ncbi:MAG: hypothetical protein IKJ73_09580 [Lachnospiraceae bacterium]|nr:hypothetical protein [Lachnospiraceae bacterium]
MNKGFVSRRYIRIVALMMVLLLVLSGCNKDKKQEKVDANATVVFQYGDNIVTLGEVYIYSKTVGERYVRQYGEDVWSLNLDGKDGEKIPMTDVVKEEIVEEIVRVKTLVAHAGEYKIELSDVEKNNITNEATVFYEGLTDQDIADMELNYDKVYKVMEENTIARKVKEKVLKDTPIEVSDEKARMTTFYDMYFQCYTIDDNGVITPYSAEDKAIQYQNALQACSALATSSIDGDREAGNIETLAEYYNLENAKEQTLSPEAIYETYGEDVYNLLYSMKNGDYSTVIETEYGYHVFQMIALTDQKATNSRKEIIREEMMVEAMDNHLTAWRMTIDNDFSYEKSVDMEVYNKITFK